MTVVARDGFDGATAERIAGQAGVSKGLLWHYFTGKTDLMEQAAAEAVRGLRDEVTRDLDAELPPVEFFRLLIRRVAGFGRSHPEELRALGRIARSLRAPDGAQAFGADRYEELYQAQEALFLRAQAEGTFRPFDPRVMAVTCQAGIDTMLAYFDAHPGTDADEYADALSDILLTAMRAPGRP